MATQTTALYDIMLKHRKADYRQYNASHRYKGWMGKTPGAVIQRSDELSDNGEKVRLHFTDDLGYRNIGTGTLEGNEAVFGTDYYDLQPIWYREAVKLKKSDAKKAITNQAAIQRHSVRTWHQNIDYQAIIDAMEAVANDDSAYAEAGAADGSTRAHVAQVTFLEASEAQRDGFLTANADRLVFGNDAANVVAGDMSASLLNLDPSTDGASVSMLKKMKQLARQDKWAAGGARPINPVSADETKGRAFFKVCFGQAGWEQIDNDEDLKRYNTDARLRGVENHPLFQDGDMVYKGLILSEETRLPTYAGLGAGGADIEPVKLFGAQALGMAVGQRMRYTKSDTRDYEFYDGVGVESQQSFEKLLLQGGDRAGQNYGMIEGYIAI